MNRKVTLEAHKVALATMPGRRGGVGVGLFLGGRTIRKPGRLTRLAAVATVLMLLNTHAIAAPTQGPTSFADEAFKTTWTRTDSFVQDGTVKRSYYWGPQPDSGPLMEDYDEGPGGKHLVQYFDKSRMEINDPNGDKTNPFYVTNGLLTRELISGQMQVGNYRFVYRYPAQIDIASDADDPDAPTYASFGSVVSRVNIPDLTGQTVVGTIDRAGKVGNDSHFASYGVKYAHKESQGQSYYNIPSVFWDFLNASGPIISNGYKINGRLSDPYFYATGFPLSDAYWARVKIEGKANTDVLIQPYERRVLTYVPSAPAGFNVQMGNIGQHYYDWRYNNAGKPVLHCTMLIDNAGFATLWASNGDVQDKLGCYTAYTWFDTDVVYQPFEHGTMIDVIVKDYGGPHGALSSVTKDLYVLFADGSMRKFTDTYVDGAPDPPSTPPAGLYAPKSGFGKLWHNSSEVQQLGWATSPEAGVHGSSSKDLFGYFDKGYMVHAGTKTFVLYDDQGASPLKANHWIVFGQ